MRLGVDLVVAYGARNHRSIRSPHQRRPATSDLPEQFISCGTVEGLFGSNFGRIHRQEELMCYVGRVK